MKDMKNIVSAILLEIGNLNMPLLIAVDGRCASGKTTLAAALKKETDCSVIHADHFFLRPEQRTEERMNEAGGNIDYERLRAEVMLPLSQGKVFSYRKFDCGKMELSDEIKIEPNKIAVIEGSYSCHPELWDFYGLRIFLTAEPEEQFCRILNRGGREAAELFRRRWIPMEEKYFSRFKIRERCDLVFQT
jgi:uridine kinase